MEFNGAHIWGAGVAAGGAARAPPPPALELLKLQQEKRAMPLAIVLASEFTCLNLGK